MIVVWRFKVLILTLLNKTLRTPLDKVELIRMGLEAILISNLFLGKYFSLQFNINSPGKRMFNLIILHLILIKAYKCA